MDFTIYNSDNDELLAYCINKYELFRYLGIDPDSKKLYAITHSKNHTFKLNNKLIYIYWWKNDDTSSNL